MFAACKSTLFRVLESAKATKRDKWVKENQGQCIISAGQIVWTVECEKALSDGDNVKRAVRALKKKWVSYLNKLTIITRSRLNMIDRNKVVSLITIEVHNRDVIEKLAKSGCTATTDFEWVSQLRFYWDRDQDDCVVKQVLSVFRYGYEYQVRLRRTVVCNRTL
jgi:dynein heavy chain, axonemal